ncbi:hypothetical protein RJ640_003562 [Escallonia rubra]|uniref:GAG-pre-integrase domain-containing protein n=1 Tax=Escallonia rubra TaxID=112253 RepID=A0AA88QBB3_9ASTE|nr:hypothetical protein RJ640_003562 [Escallonia rubra]
MVNKETSHDCPGQFVNKITAALMGQDLARLPLCPSLKTAQSRRSTYCNGLSTLLPSPPYEILLCSSNCRHCCRSLFFNAKILCLKHQHNYTLGSSRTSQRHRLLFCPATRIAIFAADLRHCNQEFRCRSTITTTSYVAIALLPQQSTWPDLPPEALVTIRSSQSSGKTIAANQDVKCLSAISETSWLWHRRLGHMHMEHLKDISSKELVRGLPKIKFEKDKVCDACQMGKQKKVSHKPKKMVSTSRPLQLLHMNLFGPIPTTSLGGKS